MDTAAAFRAYRRSPSAALRNRLVEHYAEYAARLSRIYFPRFPGSSEYEDVAQVALLGLIQAVERFEPERGFVFETFARWRILGAMRDYSREADLLTRHERAEGVERQPPASLDALEAPDHLAALGAEDRQLGAIDNDQELAQLLLELPERERMAIVLRELEGLPGEQVGEAMGISESRVSQLCTKGFSRMRARLVAA